MNASDYLLYKTFLIYQDRGNRKPNKRVGLLLIIKFLVMKKSQIKLDSLEGFKQITPNEIMYFSIYGGEASVKNDGSDYSDSSANNDVSQGGDTSGSNDGSLESDSSTHDD